MRLARGSRQTRRITQFADVLTMVGIEAHQCRAYPFHGILGIENSPEHISYIITELVSVVSFKT